MRCILLLLVLLSITLCGKISTAQTQNHNYRGNLVKFNLISKVVCLSDTLGSWSDYHKAQSSGQYNEWESFYFDHLTLPGGQSYLLKEAHSSMGPYIQMYGGANIIENESQKKERSFNQTGDNWDVIPPYFIQRTEIIPAGQGAWLINGSLGNSFIYNNDSLRAIYYGIGQHSQVLAENLVVILGKVSGRYLAVFDNGNNDYEYRLVDLSNSPGIPEESSRVVRFYGTPEALNPYSSLKQPLFIRSRQICSDLYLFQSYHGSDLHFFRFNDTSFSYVKTLSGNPYFYYEAPWDFRNNKLYIAGVLTYDLKISDTTFVFRKELPNMAKTPYEAGVDRDLNYAAQIDGDTLRIFDWDKECYIASINIKGVNKPSRPIIDYPFVYLHQTLVEDNSSIQDVEENNPAVKSYNLSAYPNPFNPVTTLEFNVPFAGNVELKIYDALGKEVTTLVNEVKKEGTYKVQFNASSLPSGIYLCRMSAGSYTVTKKVVLLK